MSEQMIDMIKEYELIKYFAPLIEKILLVGPRIVLMILLFIGLHLKLKKNIKMLSLY